MFKMAENSSIPPTTVSYRLLSPEVGDALMAAAEEAGMGENEYARSALLRALGLEESKEDRDEKMSKELREVRHDIAVATEGIMVLGGTDPKFAAEWVRERLVRKESGRK